VQNTTCPLREPRGIATFEGQLGKEKAKYLRAKVEIPAANSPAHPVWGSVLTATWSSKVTSVKVARPYQSEVSPDKSCCQAPLS